MRWKFLLVLLAACGSGSDPTAPPSNAIRTIAVRLINGDGNPIDPQDKTVWWGVGADAKFGTPVGIIEGDAIVLRDVPDRPIVLVALPEARVVPSEGWPRKVVPAGVTEVELVLDIGATRTIRVLGWRPRSFGSAYLAATTDLEPSQHSVEDDGTLRITGIRPGVRYNLFVRDIEARKSVLVRDLGADEPWPELEMARAKDIKVTVVPPAGCDFVIVAAMVDRAVLIGAQHEDDGSYTIPAVPPGEWAVVAYANHEGKYYATTAVASAGQSVTLDLSKPQR